MLILVSDVKKCINTTVWITVSESKKVLNYISIIQDKYLFIKIFYINANKDIIYVTLLLINICYLNDIKIYTSSFIQTLLSALESHQIIPFGSWALPPVGTCTLP